MRFWTAVLSTNGVMLEMHWIACLPGCYLCRRPVAGEKKVCEPCGSTTEPAGSAHGFQGSPPRGRTATTRIAQRNLVGGGGAAAAPWQPLQLTPLLMLALRGWLPVFSIRSFLLLISCFVPSLSPSIQSPSHGILIPFIPLYAFSPSPVVGFSKTPQHMARPWRGART